jgi:parallel beta-helix repeat protein
METRKKRTKVVVSVMALAALVVFSLSGYAGKLEPSAPPGPTMKTLDEVEPRTPIGPNTTPGDATCVYKITQPGSYYLTGNVIGEPNKSGIVVDADDVSIDLKGFTLKGVAGSVDGIRPLDYHSNLVVVNGIVSNWGGNGASTYAYAMPFGHSISYSRMEGLLVSDNGGWGIRAAYGSVVRSCIARDNGSDGIIMTNAGGVIEQCVAISNGGDGFACADGTTMVNCSSLNNDGVGISCMNSGHTIIGCTVTNNDAGGLKASSASVVKDCTLRYNFTFGINISFDCFIVGNEIVGTQGAGISGVNIGGQGRSRIEGNNICSNTTGIDLANNPGNFIYKNTLRSNTTNLNLGTGNSAPTSGDPATAGPWHNIILSP